MRAGYLELRDDITARLLESGDLLAQGFHLAVDVHKPHFSAKLGDLSIEVLGLFPSRLLEGERRLAAAVQLGSNGNLRLGDEGVSCRVGKQNCLLRVDMASRDSDEIGLLE